MFVFNLNFENCSARPTKPFCSCLVVIYVMHSQNIFRYRVGSQQAWKNMGKVSLEIHKYMYCNASLLHSLCGTLFIMRCHSWNIYWCSNCLKKNNCVYRHYHVLMLIIFICTNYINMCTANKFLLGLPC